MSVPRFYCDAALSPHSELTLPEGLAHHAARVLRLRDGAAIVLFDGKGGEYPGVLHIEGKQVSASLGAHAPREAELPGRITLVQGLPSGDKMDWVIEKAVELGAAAVVPIAAQRSVLQLSGARLDKRVQHWQRIAQSAAEQCGRNRLTTVEAPRSLRDYLAGPAAGLRLLCHPDAPDDLPAALASGNVGEHGLTLLVGPEGGWSESELQEAQRVGITAVRFGPRVLRTETAGLALIAASTALLGWND